MAQQIVVAWVDEEQVVAKLGAVDLGQRHTFKTVCVGRAAMWLREGTHEDAQKAEAYAKTLRCGRVFYYPQNVSDSLSMARAAVVEAAR